MERKKAEKLLEAGNKIKEEYTKKNAILIQEVSSFSLIRTMRIGKKIFTRGYINCFFTAS
jgi:hypothetical protein